MTALQLSMNRISAWPRRHLYIAAAIALTALIGAIALALFAARQNADAATLTVAMPSEKAAELVQATSASATLDNAAVGDRARVINAALPFSTAPLLAARPFAIEGSSLEQRRAELCLTQAIYYEAANEPIDGRRAVAQVVLNRVRHPAYPKSICGVVYQHSASNICQFTFVCDGSLYRAPARRQWLEAEAIARAALDGYVETAVGAATHYHADYVSPRWAPMLAKVVQLGQHIFYRWPGAWGQPAAFTGRYIGEPRDPLSMRPPPLAPKLTGEPGEIAPIAAIAAGPPVARAPNDVGGLLDTTKGWTLSIPGPDQDSAAAKLIAAQEGRKPIAIQTAEASSPTAAVDPTGR